MSMNLQVGQPDTHGTNPLRLDVPTKLIKLFDLSGEAEKLLLCTVCSSYLMPKSLQYLGSAESFDGHASDKAMGTVVFFEGIPRDKVVGLDGDECPAYGSVLNNAALPCDGLQFPNRISSQLKGTVCWACLRVWLSVPCSYCTKTVVEHGSWRAQLLTFIARQATPVDLELLSECGFCHISTGHLDQLPLRSWKSFS